MPPKRTETKQSSTFYAISKISNTTNKKLKALWILGLLLSLSAGIFLIYKNLKEYLEYNVVTESTDVQEGLQIFPAITICMSNYSHYKISLLKFADRDLEIPKYHQYVNRKYKNTADLEFFQRYPNGDCLRFNGYVNNRTQLKKNVRQTSEQFEVWFNSNNIVQSDLYLMIADNYLNVFEPSQTIRGDISNIYITKSIENKLEYPYNQCEKMADKTYRQANCIESCIYKKIADIYDCSYQGYYDVKSKPLCDDIDYKKTSVREECVSNCPIECDKISYLSTTFTTFNDDLSGIIISYNDKTYKKITQIPKMTLSTLISTLGGSLSLFIGFKLLTFVEILEYLIFS